MGVLRSTVKFFGRNPAIELMAGLGICVATVTPFWIIAGKKSSIESYLVKSDHVLSKAMESLDSMLHKENSYLKQENAKLRKKVQLLNQQLETSSSGKPMMGSKN